MHYSVIRVLQCCPCLTVLFMYYRSVHVLSAVHLFLFMYYSSVRVLYPGWDGCGGSPVTPAPRNAHHRMFTAQPSHHQRREGHRHQLVRRPPVSVVSSGGAQGDIVRHPQVVGCLVRYCPAPSGRWVLREILPGTLI